MIALMEDALDLMYAVVIKDGQEIHVLKVQ